MSDEPTHSSSYTDNEGSKVPDIISSNGDEPLDELRRILLGDSSQQDEAIYEKIDQVAHLQADGQLEEISKALPEAIIWHKTNKSNRLNNALSPTIEETLTLSVAAQSTTDRRCYFPCYWSSNSKKHSRSAEVYDGLSEQRTGAQSLPSQFEMANGGTYIRQEVF